MPSVILEYNKNRITSCHTVEWDAVTAEIEGYIYDEVKGGIDKDKSEKNRDIRVIPDDIGRLHKMESLVIQKTSIVSVPESIGFMSKLRMLRLGDNTSLEK